MKILHTVQRYAPDSGGSEEVVRQLSEHLVSFGHEVTVATSRSSQRQFKELNGVRIVEFDCSGNAVEGIRGQSKEYTDFLGRCDADIMMNYAAQIWSTDLAFALLPSTTMKKVLVPCGYSQLQNPKYAEYFNTLPETLRRYDRLVYLSPNYRDAHFGSKHGLTNAVVIRNGAPVEEFDRVKRGTFRTRHNIGNGLVVLNVSNHSRLKGHDFFWNCIASLGKDGVIPVLIGNPYASFPWKWGSECYPTCRLKGIRYGARVLEGYPRNHVIEAFVDADVFLFGSNVECSPLIMFECFASKTLFVTTDCGNVRDHEDIACVVDSEREAADIVRRYLADRSVFSERLAKGYELVREKLNWHNLSREYESLYNSLLA